MRHTNKFSKSGGVFELGDEDYPILGDDDKIIACVMHGELAHVNENWEVWLYDGAVAVVPNLVGILE